MTNEDRGLPWRRPLPGNAGWLDDASLPRGAFYVSRSIEVRGDVVTRESGLLSRLVSLRACRARGSLGFVGELRGNDAVVGIMVMRELRGRVKSDFSLGLLEKCDFGTVLESFFLWGIATRNLKAMSAEHR